MQTVPTWVIALLVCGGLVGLVIATVARRRANANRGNRKPLVRDAKFLRRPLNLIAFLIAAGIFLLGLFWRT